MSVSGQHIGQADYLGLGASDRCNVGSSNQCNISKEALDLLTMTIGSLTFYGNILDMCASCQVHKKDSLFIGS